MSIVEHYQNLEVNSEEFYQIAGRLKVKDVVYSGKRGVILNSTTIAKLGKVLHVHGGYLPDYRGSTTFYYSLLNEGYIGATGMLLNEAIDQGDIIIRKNFSQKKT